MSEVSTAGSAGVRARYRALLLDLDGTLYRGNSVVAGALEALKEAAERVVYVTNNSSRSADSVAGLLREFGFRARGGDVVTSGEAAARLAVEKLGEGARVLVVGTQDLATGMAQRGLLPVRECESGVPDAVVQGHSPHTGWSDLAEAAYALGAGAVWLATNTDPTLPTQRGLAPGNGAMVAALRTATGREPVVVGKPYPPVLEEALRRVGTREALVVGDRLDTDIEGASGVGIDSVLVLTGVTELGDLQGLPLDRWPTYIAESMCSLDQPAMACAEPSVEAVRDLLRKNPGRAVQVRTARSAID